MIVLDYMNLLYAAESASLKSQYYSLNKIVETDLRSSLVTDKLFFDYEAYCHSDGGFFGAARQVSIQSQPAEPANEFADTSLKDLQMLDTMTRMVLTEESQTKNEAVRKELERRGRPADRSSIITFGNFSVSSVRDELERNKPAPRFMDMIRKVTPSLLAADILGVQPMHQHFSSVFDQQAKIADDALIAEMTASVAKYRHELNDAFTRDRIQRELMSVAFSQQRIDTLAHVQSDWFWPGATGASNPTSLRVEIGKHRPEGAAGRFEINTSMLFHSDPITIAAPASVIKLNLSGV